MFSLNPRILALMLLQQLNVPAKVPTYYTVFPLKLFQELLFSFLKNS